MNVMNVALFASAFHPHIGGVEELVRQLALEQCRRGGSPLVVTNRWPKDLPECEDYDGLPVRRFVFRVPEPNLRQMGGALLFGPGTVRRVCAALTTHRADLIHVQCVSSNAHYALLAKRRLNLPLVVSLQGELTMDASRVFQRSAFARRLLSSLLAEADAITACSAQTLAEAEEFYGKPFGRRGQVVYNGIRLGDFQGIAPWPHPRPYILGIGRHVPQKGFDVLLRAFAQVISTGNETHDLLLAGDGTEHQSLQQLAAELGIAHHVTFLGRVDRPQAVRLFNGCSFFVLPSRHEPMGIVNLEAMAAGKAVIASRVGGVPELVQDTQNGLLFAAEDAAMLAQKMSELIDDPALRDRLGQAGLARAQSFDWSAIASQYENIYQQCLTGARGTL